MPWCALPLLFLSGALVANGVPHFVQGVCGRPFPSPFASPPGIGESPPLVNVLWGFANLAVGFVLLGFFAPGGPAAALGWVAAGLGALAMALMLARHFGRVRSATLSGEADAELLPTRRGRDAAPASRARRSDEQGNSFP